MKKKIWNKVSVPSMRATGAWIRVQPKSGTITLSQDLGAALNLKNVGLNFIQDEDRPSDWYIETSKDENAFSVRSKTGKWDKGFLIQSTALARALLASVGVEGSTRFMVATEPIEKDTYAIITKSAKTRSLKTA